MQRPWFRGFGPRLPRQLEASSLLVLSLLPTSNPVAGVPCCPLTRCVLRAGSVSLSRAGVQRTPAPPWRRTMESLQKGQSPPVTLPPFLLPSLPSLEGLLQGSGLVGGAGPGDLCSWQEWCKLCLLRAVTAAAPALPATTLAPTEARLTGFHLICRCAFLLVGGEQSSSIRFGRIRRAPSGSEEESHARRFSCQLCCSWEWGGVVILMS